MTIKIGADPELFIKKNDSFVSAYGMIKGTKEKPFVVPCGAVQVDGMALEFNIDPANNLKEFKHNIETVMATLKGMVPNYKIAITPVATFEKKYFNAQPKEALELGCDPDYNAWTGEINEPPKTDKPMRTAAGHIHIGWGEGIDPASESAHLTARSLIKQLDFYLGLPSLIFDRETARRELYGRAGAYRTKPYGAEYRVLSNRWLSNSRLHTWVYNNTIRAVGSLKQGLRLAEKYGDIQDIINNSRIADAKEIIMAENLEVPNV